MPAFTFAIPVKPSLVSVDWEAVLENLRATLDSLLASRDPRFRVLLAAHDELDIQADARIRVLPVPFDHVVEPKEGFTDKQAKLRFIGTTLRAEGYEGYVMFLDADDLVSRRLIGHVLGDDNRRGYLLRQGYRFDVLNGNLRHQPIDFDKSCGSCFVGWFTPEDFPAHYRDRKAYFSRFLRHTECFETAARHGRPPADVPFPAAVYVTNHADSLRMLKIGGRLRRVDDRDALREGTQVLADEFGVEAERLIPSSLERVRRAEQRESLEAAEPPSAGEASPETVGGLPPWRLGRGGKPLAPFDPAAPVPDGPLLDFNALLDSVQAEVKAGDIAAAYATVARHLQHPDSMGTAWALLASLVLKTSDAFDVAAGYIARAAQLGGWRRLHFNPAAAIMTKEAFRSIGTLGPAIRCNAIEFEPLRQPHPVVLVAAADETYFDAFAESYVRSARAFGGPGIGIHLHVFDATPAWRRALLKRVADTADPLHGIGLSWEATGPGEKGYYYVGRFIQLDRIMAFHQATCVVTDMDCVFVDSLQDVLDDMGQADIGLCYIDRYVFPWQNFRANMVVVRNTDGGHRVVASLRGFLASLPRETSRYYYVDQAALMMAHYAQRIGGYTATFITKAYLKTCFQPTGSGSNLQHKVDRIDAMLASKGLNR